MCLFFMSINYREMSTIDYDHMSKDYIVTNIKNVNGFGHLEIELKNEKSVVYAKSGCQMIIDNSMNLFASTGNNGIFNGILASFSTGTFFLNKVSLLPPQKSGKVSIYSVIPGTIQELIIEPGQTWCVNDITYLCSTENIIVESGISFSTFITGNGILYTRIKNKSKYKGKVWLNAWGGVINKNLTENKNFKIHSGLFLAMPESIYKKIKVKLASTIFSSIAGGQGIMMDFSETEPIPNDILYLQNNMHEFFEMISLHIIGPESSRSNVNVNFGNASNSGGGGGKNNKRITRKIRKK